LLFGNGIRLFKRVLKGIKISHGQTLFDSVTPYVHTTVFLCSRIQRDNPGRHFRTGTRLAAADITFSRRSGVAHNRQGKRSFLRHTAIGLPATSYSGPGRGERV